MMKSDASLACGQAFPTATPIAAICNIPTSFYDK
jgi:hypothetical protein